MADGGDDGLHSLEVGGALSTLVVASQARPPRTVQTSQRVDQALVQHWAESLQTCNTLSLVELLHYCALIGRESP